MHVHVLAYICRSAIGPLPASITTPVSTARESNQPYLNLKIFENKPATLYVSWNAVQRTLISDWMHPHMDATPQGRTFPSYLVCACSSADSLSYREASSSSGPRRLARDAGTLAATSVPVAANSSC